MKPQATASIVTKCVLALVITTLMLATSAGAQNTNDIRELLSTLAKANGINLILGDSVKGTVGINLSQVPQNPEETMRLILSANGFAMKKVGDIIIAGMAAELEGLSPRLSKVVSLKYASATELIGTLGGVAASSVDVQADPRTNSVIITGTDSDIQMLEQIIALLDVDIAVETAVIEPTSTKIFLLAYAQASAIQQIVSGFSSPAGEIVVDSRTNSLLITDTDSALARIEQLLSQLDIETPEEKAMREKEAEPPPEISTRIFNLNHVEASAIMEILQGMLSPTGKLQTFVHQKNILPPMQTSLSGSFGQSGSFGGQSSGSSTAAGGAAGKWSDTLVATDVDSVLDDMSKLIEKLDTKPLQVKIEARIVEANSNRMNDLGINWQAVHSSSGSTGETSFAFGQSESVSLNLGTFTAGKFEDILFRIKALETSGEAKTMFSPSVITMDNEAAQMLVADRIPIVRTYETELRSTTGVEFINVGISLSVVPHITEDGYIIMDTTPQVDYIKEWIRGAESYPIISTRLANNRVRVKNGETFVISGLTKEDDKKGRSGIPILNRIPFLGRLFGASSDSNEKTDLMIFITPTILSEEP